MKTLATLTIASLFSLTASASNVSISDYESYAQSSIWPSCAVPLYSLGLASTYFIRNKQHHFTL